MTEVGLYGFIAQSKRVVLSIPMEAKRRAVEDFKRGRIINRMWHRIGHRLL